VGLLRSIHPGVLFFAVPNGGARSKRVAVKLKAEGVLAGVSDLFVSEPRGEFHGLYLEMKRTVGGSTSAKQRWFLKRAAARGYKTVVCDKGSLAALRVVEDYLELQNPNESMLGKLHRVLG